MQLDERAIVRVRRQVDLPAAPDEVWRLLADIAGWHRWMPNVAFTSLPEPPRVGTVFQWKINGMHMVSRVEAMEPARRMGWSSRGFGTRGAHLWSLEEVAGAEGDGHPATRVERVEVVSGWVAWLLRGTIRKTLELSADLWMESLKERLEAAS